MRHKSNPIYIRIFALLICIFILSSFCLFEKSLAKSREKESYPPRLTTKVKKVIDCSTFLIGGGQRSTFIGISKNQRKNTITKTCFNFLKKLIEGQTVKLEIDKKLIDRYGQVQYYLFLEDGTFVNLLLILRGFTRAVIKYPNIRYQEKLQNAEKLAKKHSKGIWQNF
ncbi:MAG: hypothetical protein CMH79_02510 [Nitrospinae bacterium]|nr:hypothetical protein [Nitrospinota bacterium]|tara:strand:+ start:3769 stop:4272 length:504 start_codon:yes stop_codon:yes gene_type:complete